MPNIDFRVDYYEEHDNGAKAKITETQLAARIRSLGPEFRNIVQDAMRDALEEGLRVAKAEAPEGERHVDIVAAPRLKDAIFIEGLGERGSGFGGFRAGGLGGGGTHEARLVADAAIAPQLAFVYDGTAGEGAGHIRSRTPGGFMRIPNVVGSAGVVHKGRNIRPGSLHPGFRYHFVKEVRGQKPQREWWARAQAAINDTLEQRLDTARFIKGLD